jgi:hypothetical protein
MRLGSRRRLQQHRIGNGVGFPLRQQWHQRRYFTYVNCHSYDSQSPVVGDIRRRAIRPEPRIVETRKSDPLVVVRSTVRRRRIRKLQLPFGDPTEKRIAEHVAAARQCVWAEVEKDVAAFDAVPAFVIGVSRPSVNRRHRAETVVCYFSDDIRRQEEIDSRPVVT